MKIHFLHFARFIKENYLNDNSKIIEIGSNDGTFLENFMNSNLESIGFEPSANVAAIANKEENLAEIDPYPDNQKIILSPQNPDVIYAAIELA